MDHSPGNTFVAHSLDRAVTPERRQTRGTSHHLSSSLPKLVPLQPPPSNLPFSKEQKRPVNVFKKLTAREPCCPRVANSKLLPDVPKNQESFLLGVQSNIKPLPPAAPYGVQIHPQRKDLDPRPLPSLRPHILPSLLSPAESEPCSAVYTPNPSLLEALNMTFERVLSIEPMSFSKPTLISRNPTSDKQAKAAPASIQPQAQPKIPARESFGLHPMTFSPPPKPHASRPACKKRGPQNRPDRKSASSSRKSPRDSMLGQHRTGRISLTSRDESTAQQSRRSSNLSLGSTIQLCDLKRTSKTQYRRSFRHVQALKRQPTLANTETFLPPLDLSPLTFSPLLPEFSDYSSGRFGSGCLSPFINVPNITTALTASLTQPGLKSQKSERRLARVPSTFLCMGSPITPVSPPTSQESFTDHEESQHIGLSRAEEAQDVILPTKVISYLPGSSLPPRLDSLHGRPRGSLPKTPVNPAQNNSGNWTPRLMHRAPTPKLTLHVPTAILSIHNPIHEPFPFKVKSVDDSKVNTRKTRPLPPIPITRQTTV